MSGRLQDELLARVTTYGARVLALVEELERSNRPRRVIEQLAGSGTAPGANLFEANEAMSTADFVKSVAWAAKELSETRYWLMVIAECEWFPMSRLAPLLDETGQLLGIVKVIIARTRRNERARKASRKIAPKVSENLS